MVAETPAPLLADVVGEGGGHLPDPWWAHPWEMVRLDHGEPITAPQCIAHRGYKAKYPENSMAAFRAAVAAGAHAIETDLHLTKDGVVVLAHDATLKRCFGVGKKVNDCEWGHISSLRTLRQPREPMPRLDELLGFLNEDGLEKVWLLLDIKVDDDCEELMRRTAATIASCPPHKSHPWNERIIFGCWNQAYINQARIHLKDYPLTHIGISLPYAARLLAAHPNLSFNLLHVLLSGPLGPRFLSSVRESHPTRRPVFAWTVNGERWMERAVLAGVDGVVTDDVEAYLDVCARWLREETGRRSARGKPAVGGDSTRSRVGGWGKGGVRFGRRRGWVSDLGGLALLLCGNVLAAVAVALFTLQGRYGEVTRRPRPAATVQ